MTVPTSCDMSWDSEGWKQPDDIQKDLEKAKESYNGSVSPWLHVIFAHTQMTPYAVLYLLETLSKGYMRPRHVSAIEFRDVRLNLGGPSRDYLFAERIGRAARGAQLYSLGLNGNETIGSWGVSALLRGLFEDTVNNSVSQILLSGTYVFPDCARIWQFLLCEPDCEVSRIALAGTFVSSAMRRRLAFLNILGFFGSLSELSVAGSNFPGEALGNNNVSWLALLDRLHSQDMAFFRPLFSIFDEKYGTNLRSMTELRMQDFKEGSSQTSAIAQLEEDQCNLNRRMSYSVQKNALSLLYVSRIMLNSRPLPHKRTTERKPFPWFRLPSELQHKILTSIVDLSPDLHRYAFLRQSDVQAMPKDRTWHPYSYPRDERVCYGTECVFENGQFITRDLLDVSLSKDQLTDGAIEDEEVPASMVQQLGLANRIEDLARPRNLQPPPHHDEAKFLAYPCHVTASRYLFKPGDLACILSNKQRLAIFRFASDRKTVFLHRDSPYRKMDILRLLSCVCLDRVRDD